MPPRRQSLVLGKGKKKRERKLSEYRRCTNGSTGYCTMKQVQIELVLSKTSNNYTFSRLAEFKHQTSNY